MLHLSAQTATLGGWQLQRRVSAALGGLPLSTWLWGLGVMLPLCLHVVIGIRQALSSRSQPGEGGVSRPLQHVSGALVIAFLVLHGGRFRWRAWRGELGPSDVFPDLCSSLSSTAEGGVPLVACAYLMGVAAASFHAVHGIYRAALALGVVSTARKSSLGRWCTAAGLALFSWGALIIIDLATGSVVIHLPG